MKRESLTLAAVALLSALAGVVVFRFMAPDAEIVGAPPGHGPAPLQFDDLAFADANGVTHKLSDWKQPLLVINFWAPWCAPCRREIPALIELQRKHENRIQTIGLAFDSRDNVRAFSDKFPFNYPLLLMRDNSASINRFFGNASGGLPFTAILDQRRQIVFRHAGEISLEALEKAIKRL